MGKMGDKMGNIGAGLIVLLSKIGLKLLGVIIKFAKFGKAGLAIGTAVTYSYLFTWQFALVIMASLLFHEYGHIFAMKRCGLKTRGIYFIPFLGAAAVSEEEFKSRRDEVYIAIMGPIWGMALAVITSIIYLVSGNAFFGAAAGWMAMVNLFNLLPINPLDGGRIMKSVAFSIGSDIGFIFLAVGTLVSVLLTFYFGVLLFSFLLFIGFLEVVYEIKYREPRYIIRACKKDINKLIEENPPVQVRIAATRLKEILLDKNDNDLNKMKKIRNLGSENNINNFENFDLYTLARILLIRIEKFSPMPKMEIVGIISSILVYIIVALILWEFMAWMNHIPEVDIARQIFMS